MATQATNMRKKEGRCSEWGRPEEPKKQKTLDEFEEENNDK